MTRFVDCQRELRELDALLEKSRSQFVVVYGRRRVGKTTLLLRWGQRSGRPYIYWVARRETADASRQAWPARCGVGPIPMQKNQNRRVLTPGRCCSSKWRAC